jgi:NAD(P)-dependent dehydrogenase (short-subunit alcohol dehydrogenase family)
MDIRDAASVEHGVAVARDRLGRLDVLVCNAGIAGPTARLHEADFDEWRDTLEVNVFGTTRVLRAALPPLVEQRHGAVVVIGSMTGKRPLANRTAYATSKMALVGLVRSLAAEIGPDGVRVNLVSPGPVDGERLHRVIEQQVATTAVGFAETRQKLLGDSMLIGAVPPRDVARTVAFLASDHAASITGEDVNVSRGIVCH